MLNFSFIVAIPCAVSADLSVHYVKVQIPHSGTPTLYDLALQGDKLAGLTTGQLASYWRQIDQHLQERRVRDVQRDDFLVVQAYHRQDFNFEQLDDLVRSGDQELVGNN